MTTPLSGSTDSPYDESYFQETYEHETVRRLSMHWWSVQLYARIAKRWLKRTGGTKFLDCGCSLGHTLQAMPKEADLSGLDVSEYAISKAREQLPAVHLDVVNLEQQWPDWMTSTRFDVVLAKYVFEHLHEPATVIQRLSSVLSDSGVLIFSVPNTESLGAKWKGDDWYALSDPTHVSLLPPSDWLTMCEEAGLTVVESFSDGYWDLPYFQSIPKMIQAPVFLWTCAIACVTARPLLPFGFGENVIIVAKK